MTTDDDMREIEAALDNLIAVERDRALDGIGETRKMRGDLLALIRQKLPNIGPNGDHRIDIQTDGSGKAEGCTVYMTDKDGRTTKFLPVTDDAEHERAVEAWKRHLQARGDIVHGFSYCIRQEGVEEALRLMRARLAKGAP